MSMSRSPHSPLQSDAIGRRLAPTRIGVGIALVLIAGSASSRNLNPGENEVVFAGDPVETWTGDQANLAVGPGALTDSISLRESTLGLHRGSVVGVSFAAAVELINSTGDLSGSISHASGSGLVIFATPGSGLPVSNVGAYQLAVAGSGRGVDLGGGSTLYLSGSSVTGSLSGGTGQGVGLYLSSGSVSLRDQASVTGATTGVEITQNTFGGSVTGGASVLVDASRVEGSSGHAILVREDGEPVVADITVRNGSLLFAGNGVLLEVQDAATATFNVDSSSLAGDIVNGVAATTHVNLGNSASITGIFDNVTSATMSGGAQWRLTGDSSVGALALGSDSIVALGDGAGFNTLTVNGDYTGAGGTLLFNTVLGDDASASDKLIVTGATSGQTNVAVNNVGGAGAQTVNGIELIQVGGASNGVFTLAGRAVGSQYEYFLHQGSTAAPTNGNWYLRSELPTAPDPCLTDPTLPGCTPVVPPDPDPCLADPTLPGCSPVVPPDPDPCLADPTAPGCLITLPDPCMLDPSVPQCQPPVPVLRPEPGAYLANQAAATQMFGIRLHDRTGGIARGLSERGAWARVSRNQAEYGVIGDQLSVNGDSDVLQIGTDLLSWGADSRGQFGVMLGGGRANNTVTSRLTGYSARGKVEGQSVGLYASWLQDPAATIGLYVDTWAQYARFKNTVQGDALAKERYDSDAGSASVEAGYSFKVLDSASTAMFVEPQLQLTYTDFSADRHVETNGTVIDGSDAGGLTSRVGVRVFGHANTAVGNRVQPFVAVNWIHGADDNSLRFDGERMEGGLPQDRYEAKAGAQLQLGQRWTAWGDMGLQRGQGGYRNVSGQIGLRASW